MVAKEIHKRSAGKGKPFVAVDCAAITTNLFESEMFGHKKGAFTVADSDRIGKIAQAEGGILFLDEIGNLELDHQGKLLRFFQEMEYTHIGDNVTLLSGTLIEYQWLSVIWWSETKHRP